MSGKSLAAVLFLPLPFAALPLAALLFTGSAGAPSVAVHQDMVTIQLLHGQPASPLARNVDGPPRNACAHTSISPIEG